MISTTRYFPIILLFIVAGSACAQGPLQVDTIRDLKPEFRRLINHEAIDREQKNILASDGKADNVFTISTNDEINFFVTSSVVTKVDRVQYKIEKDTILDHRLKVLYLKGLENMLHFFNGNWRNKNVNPSAFPIIIAGYEKCMQKDIVGESIESTIDSVPYDAGLTILSAGIFDKNAGYAMSKNNVFRKYCALYPEKILPKLYEDSNYPFTDSLIKVAAYMNPGLLYDYAAAGNPLGYAIRKVNDPLVKAVSRMATSTSGRLYFPFLDNITKGQMSFAEIDAAKNDSIRYYKLLVKTHLDYVKRELINRDTVNGTAALSAMLARKAEEVFVNTINGLHEVANPAIRFKILQTLTAEELYYLAVSTDGIIYTSSFVTGVYPLIMSRCNQRADSLLMRLNFDKYRKFIKMCAAYNTLGNFLAAFPNPDDAKKLMQAFVGNLEKSKGLEDGVDVADSYASLTETNKNVADEMLANVKYNYQRNLNQNNKRGVVMYNLLHQLFLSADTTNNIDLSKEFGIPPIYNIDYNSLADDSGRVIQQVFFYGDEDKDGQNSFVNFMGMFKGKSDWIIAENPDWVWIRSANGKPVWIFANKPLFGDDDPDAKAQAKLDEYLEARKLKPTIFIHRGHSFHVKYSMAQIQPSARIVILGSCGGYNNLNEVLNISPDAHIISSKQVGTKTVNEPILQAINTTLRLGKNVDWIPIWKDLSKQFSGASKEKFDDYIPPYKNLGALFIKAYKIAMGNNSNQ